MRVNHPEKDAVGTPARNAPPASAMNSRVMLTTIELLDRVAEIECATTLKDQRRRVPTEFDGVGAGLAFWAATYGPFASWRILCVAWAQQARNTTYAQAWIFIAVEIAVAIPTQMHNFWTMWSSKKRNRPKLRLMGEEVPMVDVFITCCGEDDDLVLDTVRGALDVHFGQLC